jgi:hypothetical protein
MCGAASDGQVFPDSRFCRRVESSLRLALASASGLQECVVARAAALVRLEIADVIESHELNVQFEHRFDKFRFGLGSLR